MCNEDSFSTCIYFKAFDDVGRDCEKDINRLAFTDTIEETPKVGLLERINHLLFLVWVNFCFNLLASHILSSLIDFVDKLFCSLIHNLMSSIHGMNSLILS